MVRWTEAGGQKKQGRKLVGRKLVGRKLVGRELVGRELIQREQPLTSEDVSVFPGPLLQLPCFQLP